MKNFPKLSLVAIIAFAFVLHCSDTDRPLPLGTPMKMMGIDTSGDGNKDAFGYYLTSKNNRRVVYQEIDSNSDRQSDIFIWAGSSTRKKPDDTLSEAVKVYEESDENKNGIIDTIRWYLPNEYISLVMKDKDEDGYFEVTEYFNYQKVAVRTEIDTNKDGFADIYIWGDRAEIDSNFDKTPDLVVYGKSVLELEEKAMNKRDTKPLSASQSWFLNPKLIPIEQRSIIGSGVFVE